MIIKINPLEVSEILAKAAIDNILSVFNVKYEQEVIDNFYRANFDYFFEILTNSEKEDNMNSVKIPKGTKVRIVEYGTIIQKPMSDEGIDTLVSTDIQPFLIGREGVINKYDISNGGYIVDGIPEKCGFYYKDQLLIID